MAKRKPDDPPKGAPAWTSTFGDLMNLLLCFFVLLFSMSTVDAQKFELLAASFNQTFSIFSAGATAIGDGMMISNGVSQLNELDNYVSSVGRDADGSTIMDDVEKESEDESKDEVAKAKETLAEAQLEESEQLAEKISEALEENNLEDDIDIEFTSQFVQLTLNGALLFDSGSVELKQESLYMMKQVGFILEKYAESTIEVEGHTDNVPMTGNRKYSNNDELSAGRAQSVFNYLKDNTILDLSKIKHSGRGEYKPIADNSTPEGRAMNRRVEIRIYNSLSDY